MSGMESDGKFPALGLPGGRRSVVSSVEFEANMLPRQLDLCWFECQLNLMNKPSITLFACKSN